MPHTACLPNPCLLPPYTLPGVLTLMTWATEQQGTSMLGLQ